MYLGSDTHKDRASLNASYSAGVAGMGVFRVPKEKKGFRCCPEPALLRGECIMTQLSFKTHASGAEAVFLLSCENK